MIKALIKLANQLDSKGMNKEADYLDRMIFSYAQMDPDEKPEDFLMLDDDFDDEKPEESGPLQIDLGPDSVEKVTTETEREPVIEEYTLEAKGFDKKDGHASKYTKQHGHASDEIFSSAESLTRKLAEETGYVYIEDMRDPNADAFSRSRMIDGKPGILLQDLIKMEDTYGDGPTKYQVVLKTYDENGRVVYYHRLMKEEEIISENYEGAMMSAAPNYSDEFDNPRRRSPYNTPFGR